MPRQLVRNQDLSTDVQRLNLLTNGGFEIWQRGGGPFSANAAYAADGWYLGQVGGTGLSLLDRTSTTYTDANSGSCGEMTVSALAAESYLWQKVENARQLAGRTVSFSARVKATVGNAVRLVFYDATGGFQFGSFHNGNGQYQTLTFTGTWNVAATAIYAGFAFGANGVFYVDNAMLVVGSQPADYAPLHPADDLARCLRYYRFIGSPGGGEVLVSGYNGAGGSVYTQFIFGADMAITPTVTKVGTWTTNNAGQPSAGTVTSRGFYGAVVVTATGYGYASNSPSSPSPTFTCEANP